MLRRLLRPAAASAPRPPGKPTRRPRPLRPAPRALGPLQRLAQPTRPLTAGVPVALRRSFQVLHRGGPRRVNRRKDHLLEKRKENLRHLATGLSRRQLKISVRGRSSLSRSATARRAAPRPRPDCAPHPESIPRRSPQCAPAAPASASAESLRQSLAGVIGKSVRRSPTPRPRQWPAPRCAAGARQSAANPPRTAAPSASTE